ncbi:MFS sugar transporter-like protein [Acephala macrosclerotiorum]|nr:MFS sugar transporter-like protein [Acephala macrosclerotiorum]
MTILTGAPLSWAITATAGSGFLLFGYDQGVMSGLLTGSAFTQQFPSIDTTNSGHGSSSLQGTAVAIYEIGCFFGSIFCFLFGEKLGRRKCIMLGYIVLSIGAALQASSNTIAQLIVVWHAELMKAHKRGKGLAVELAINIFGVMMAYWVDYGFSYVNSAAQFRVPLALQIVFAVITFAGIIVLPESLRWLLAHDKHEKARHILWALEHNANLIDPSNEVIQHEMAEIQHAIYEERAAAAGAGGTRALLKNGPQRFLHRTLLGIGGQFMQQLSGINLITYYAPVIFEESVGLSHSLSLLLSGFNGVAYFFSSLIPIWVIDRLGRRKLMLLAAAGQMACMAILAGTVSNGSKSAGYVATVMLFLFNFFFAVGLLAIPWLLPAEYAPLAIRTPAASLASASNWIFTFLVVEITPVSIKSIEWRTYIYFAVFNAFFIPLIYFFYPETKNLSLEQIDELFTGDKVLLHWKASMNSTEVPQDDGLRQRFAEKTEVKHIDDGVVSKESL